MRAFRRNLYDSVEKHRLWGQLNHEWQVHLLTLTYWLCFESFLCFTLSLSQGDILMPALEDYKKLKWDSVSNIDGTWCWKETGLHPFSAQIRIVDSDCLMMHRESFPSHPAQHPHSHPWVEWNNGLTLLPGRVQSGAGGWWGARCGPCEPALPGGRWSDLQSWSPGLWLAHRKAWSLPAKEGWTSVSLPSWTLCLKLRYWPLLYWVIAPQPHRLWREVPACKLLSVQTLEKGPGQGPNP